jgi:hypothetical protein
MDSDAPNFHFLQNEISKNVSIISTVKLAKLKVDFESNRTDFYE